MKCPLFLCALISLFLCNETQARVTAIVTPPPPIREVIVIPPGYSTCHTLQPQFYDGVWQYQHRVCEYERDEGAAIWIAGYWQCVHFSVNGRCMRTAWVRSHWVEPEDREYRRFRRGQSAQREHRSHEYEHKYRDRYRSRTISPIHRRE